MNLNDKKGVSGVVTAVLLILLVIAAIGILWVVVQNFVDEGASQIKDATACQTTTLEIVSASGATNEVVVKRVRGSSTVDELRVFTGGTFTIDHPVTGNFGIGETNAITVSGLAEDDKIEVSAMFDGTICPPGATYTATE